MYYPGSHRFEDYLYHDGCKSVSDAERLTDDQDMRARIKHHVHSLKEQAAQRGIEKAAFAAKKGDVLIWHADLVHGGNPVSRITTRKSVVTHYCPKHLMPLFFERMDAPRIWNHDGHRYTTSHYLTDPLT
jgi:phytanoyl-CoA hydroxylase